MHHLLLKPKNLIVARHAESVRNKGKKGVFYTTEERAAIGEILNQDIPLTEAGHQQARALGEKLYKEFRHFDIIINSGYMRTKETMQGILSAFPEETLRDSLIIEDIALRERDAGWAYLMTQEEVTAHFPWYAEVWKINNPFFNRPAGGESLADVVVRLDPFFIRLAQLCVGKNVLIVGHGRAIVAMQSLLENWNHGHYKTIPDDLPNTGFLHYSYSEEQEMLVRKD